MLPTTSAGRAVLGAYLSLVVVHLTGQWTSADGLAQVTQWFLMPLLALLVLVGTRRPRGRLFVLVLAALVWSWLGDSAPDAFSGDTAFLVMVGCFLVAQVLYVVAFWPARRSSVLAVRRGWLAGYAALVAVVLLACAPHAGPLLVPVAAYALCIGAMAVLATGLGPWVTVGALAFVISDAFIALRAFTPWWDLPQQGFWVMLTYTAGQLLIVLGVLSRPGSAGALAVGAGSVVEQAGR